MFAGIGGSVTNQGFVLPRLLYFGFVFVAVSFVAGVAFRLRGK